MKKEYVEIKCQLGALVFKLSVWCGAEGCVSGLRQTKYDRQQPLV